MRVCAQVDMCVHMYMHGRQACITRAGGRADGRAGARAGARARGQADGEGGGFVSAR